MRQGCQRSRSEQPHQFAVELLTDALAAKQDLVDVDAKITQIVAERP
jgi:hypothetical protein